MVRMERCYVCRRPKKSLQVWRANVAVKACRSCFTAVTRVRELEEREAELSAALGFQEIETEKGEAYDDALSAAARILYRVVSVVSKDKGKGHALVRVETLDGATWACHMPGCELCEVVSLAKRFIDHL